MIIERQLFACSAYSVSLYKQQHHKDLFHVLLLWQVTVPVTELFCHSKEQLQLSLCQ